MNSLRKEGGKGSFFLFRRRYRKKDTMKTPEKTRQVLIYLIAGVNIRILTFATIVDIAVEKASYRNLTESGSDS